tara:strand:- start:289 stop:534 length:246 start_codon:yes stop_codon:yes gene_type:complete
MSYTKIGSVKLYSNKFATEENKQPHFKADLQIDHDIPAGAMVGVAGWLDEKNGDKSLFFQISAKDEELGKATEKEDADIPF